MARDGRSLYLAKTAIDERRRENEKALLERRREAYARSPALREIDAALAAAAPEILAAALSTGDRDGALTRLRDRNLALQAERERALRAAGLPPDYLDERYDCAVCQDTGYDGRALCRCLLARYQDEQRRALSALLKLGEETFDAFDLDLYDARPDAVTGISPRQSMDFVYEYCVRYAEKFGAGAHNLFFRGGTGLGKTFLSACIARVVSERGFSVVYETANGLFARLEEEKFSKAEDEAGARSDVRRFFACDLLILDDLGTEMMTAFTVSALYNLVNARQCAGKRTIVSSNLTDEELRRRYTPQILSRLEGDYEVLRFYGRDIRLLKKEQF